MTTCPPNHTSLTPFLCNDGAAAAIDFYVSVFGAKLVDRMDGPNDIVAQAERNATTAWPSGPRRTSRAREHAHMLAS